MSPVCDWARVDLCQKPQGSVSLIKCMEAGCNRLLHHMCQCMWESEDEDVRQAHGSRKFCAHHHPAGAFKGPPSIVLQEFSQSTMDTMSQITHCPSLPPMENVNIAGQSLPANGQDCTNNNQEDDFNVADEELPPLTLIWDCPYVEKQTSTGWKCLWCKDKFVPAHATRALYHVIRLTGKGIKPCKASIPANYLARYQALLDDGSSKSESKKRAVEVVDQVVALQQNSAVATLIGKKRQCGSGLSTLHSHFKPSHQVSASSSSKDLFGKSIQQSISAGIHHQTDIRQVNHTKAQMAIADFFHCENIPDSVVESPRFKRMVHVLSKTGSDFEIPKRKQIGGSLLDLNFQTKYNDNKANLLKGADVFGLSFLGDGATVKRMPLMNILASCADNPPITVSIQDCTKHLQQGGKKDASYIAEMFDDIVKEYDPHSTLTDVFFFDGASNVQKGGAILVAKHPRSFCFHGGEHVLSLFFSSLSRIKPIKLLILKTCRLYNVFGSGAHHAIYAQFMAQTSNYNKGRPVGLLRGAGTRFASWFYAMHRVLRLRQALLSTIHQQKFLELESVKKPSVRSAIQDIEDKRFWKCLYLILRCVFPALRALRYCDASKPVMDKIFFLSHRTTEAIKRSQEFLNDPNLFGALKMDRNLEEEGNEVLGGDSDDDEGEDVVFEDTLQEQPGDVAAIADEEQLSEGEESVVTMAFGEAVLAHWNRRKEKIGHQYAIAAWALCVMKEVRQDVSLRLKGIHRDAIEEVVTRLHLPPCPNKRVNLSNMTPADIVDTFWNEFKAFQNCTEPFHVPSRWATQDVLLGRSHLWHEKYSLDYTQVLGFVACRVCSKLCGIGPAERAWAAVKTIKRDKRSHLGGKSTEKRSVIYITAKQQEGRLNLEQNEKIDAVGRTAMFGDDDINFDLQLEKWDVDSDALKEPQVSRIFQAWVEDWEGEIRMRNDPVVEARLMQKYQSLVFLDPDTGKTFHVYQGNMEYRRGRGNGWFVLAVCSDDAGGEEENMEAFSLEVACELIGTTEQTRGVSVVTLLEPTAEEGE